MSECCEEKVVDYTAMSAPEMLDAIGDDAYLWATAFCQTAKQLGYEIDHGWMIGWFANAIEHSTDVRQRRMKPDTQPVLTVGLNGHAPA